MSSEERSRVLRMVAEGKIGPEEGLALLDALEPVSSPAVRPAETAVLSQEVSRRNLVIDVVEDGSTKVNVRIPLGLARAAGRFIPRQAQEYLNHYGIDLQQFLGDLTGSLTTGPLVEVEDDDGRVRIAVE